MSIEIGKFEAQSIDQKIDRILRDLGNPEPPLRLELVLELLKLDLSYYRADDVSQFREFAHRITVAGKQLAARPALALDALRKAKLSALWVPDTKRIFIDESIPKAKHRWIQGHEITHAISDWHQTYLFGDNDSTLDPSCHAQLEAEANYGAGRLLFLGDRFAEDAKDCKIDFEGIKQLKDRYGNSLTSTFWRTVEAHGDSVAVFGLVSQHPRYPEIGEGRNGQPWRDFPRSSAFQKRFSRIDAANAFSLIARHTTYKKRGPIIAGTDVLIDDNGVPHAVEVEGFCNTHSVLTLGVIKKALDPGVVVSALAT